MRLELKVAEPLGVAAEEMIEVLGFAGHVVASCFEGATTTDGGASQPPTFPYGSAPRGRALGARRSARIFPGEARAGRVQRRLSADLL